MNINIYTYKTVVNLVSTDRDSTLENMQVFHDKLKLYKTLTNEITFRIRNKDRVHQSFKNSVIILNIIDNKDRLVAKLDLEYIESNKRYIVKVLPETIDDLNNGTDYKYFVTIRDIYTDTETPLFTDHINSIFGTLEIIQPFVESKSTEYTEIIDITPKKVFNTRWWVIDHVITNYEDVESIEIIVPECHCYQVKLKTHTRKYAPINIAEDWQWKEYMTFHDVTGTFKLPKLEGFDMRYIIMVENLNMPEYKIKVSRFPQSELTLKIPML